MVVREEEVETIIYGNLRLFGFDTLLGTFQIVGAPELLADWVNTEHRSWYVDQYVNRS